MSRQFTACPFCGGPLTIGDVSLHSMSDGGSLRWDGRNKVEREQPLRLFGRTFFNEKTIKYTLMDRTLKKENQPAQLCEACKMVIATFPIHFT